MRGSYFLRIRNNRISYDISIRRCITIIKGNSGTGKTTLLSMINSYLNIGKTSGIKINTNINSIRLLFNITDWKYDLESHKNSVYFADEDVKYILTKEFCDLLYKTGSYLVYITRSGRTGFLQYSISDIYEFKSRRDNNIYINELYKLYSNEESNFTPDIILTEDSTYGKDMLDHSLNIYVETSCGKDNMVNKLKEVSNNYINIYIIVDGAAFGNQIQLLFATISSLISCNILVFAPESFEYLILNTSKFKQYCTDELINTQDYVDSSRYKTWENYFEDLLCKLCSKYYKYVKCEKVKWGRLNIFFKKAELLKEITDQLVDLNESVKNY